MNTTPTTRRALLTGGFTAIAVAIAIAPAHASHDTQQQTKCVEDAPYYLHGNTTDESDSGTFDQQPPNADQTLPQLRTVTIAGAPTGHGPQEFLSASWSGDFTGTVCGQAQLTLHVTAPLPQTSQQFTRVEFLVDDANSLTGGSISLPFPHAVVPTEVPWTVPVDGTANETLEILLTPSSRTPFTVLYDHTDHQSQFTISTLQPCDTNDPHPDCQQQLGQLPTPRASASRAPRLAEALYGHARAAVCRAILDLP